MRSFKLASIALVFTLLSSSISPITPAVMEHGQDGRPPQEPVEGPFPTGLYENLATGASAKVLIVTGGHGPLTGISPWVDKDFWLKVLAEMGMKVDWYHGIPPIDLLMKYDLVIYTAGGYWYPLDLVTEPLSKYHFAGKPLIVVAPNINFNWWAGVPEFSRKVLHIEGALGIMYWSSYHVYADTGHQITLEPEPLPYSIFIPAVNSYPDCFDPAPDAEGVLTQGYMYSEFGVGTAAKYPSYTYQTPYPPLYAVVAYPGAVNEGRVVTFGFVPAGIDPAVGKRLAMNTITWSLVWDTTPPVSSVGPIEPYWQIKIPITITATAADDISGVDKVELWYRYSRDNLTWAAWKLFGVDNKEPWSWLFTAPDTYGYYEFYSIAVDRAGNVEEAPEYADAKCHYWKDMLMITNKKGLIKFARETGEANPEERVNELLRVTRGIHPEGVLVFLDEILKDPLAWTEIDRYVETFVRAYPNVRYLMILGGPRVVPFYYVSDPTRNEENIAADTLYGDITNDWHQDIAVGRIAGTDVENMVSLIKRVDPKYYRTSSLAIISCGDAAVRDATDAAHSFLLKAKFPPKDILYLREDDPAWRHRYIDGLPNRAIIVHDGHGSPTLFAAKTGKGKEVRWQYLSSWDVRQRGLGITNPVVLGNGCHTAIIEEGEYRMKDRVYFIRPFARDTISMTFIENGASSFVGSTRLSYFHPWFTWYSEIITRDLIKHLAEDKDIGLSLMHARNSVGGWFSRGAVNRKTWLEFVLYGNPKFNPIFPSGKHASTPLPLVDSIELTVEVPEYSRTIVEGYDVINVPEAQFLFNPGYPLIPILVKQLKLEENYQLAAIELVDVELEEIENVKLLTDQVQTSVPLPELEYPIVGLYPGFTHAAGVYQHLDGTKTLQFIVAPLQYDKAKERVYLYRRMRFRLNAEPSLISVAPACWSDEVELGRFVQQEFEIRNLGPEPLRIELEKTGKIEEYVSFDIHVFTLLPGEARKVMVTFTTTEVTEVGTYTGEILAKSTQGKQSIPVAITVFAPAPRIAVVKEFKPTSIHERRSGAVMPRTTVTNINKVEITKFEIVDELLENWIIKNLRSVSVSYFDRENVEYGVSKKALRISLINRKLHLSVDFSIGIEVQNENLSKVIYSLKEEERIEFKYPMHLTQRLWLDLYEAWFSVKALSPKGSTATMKTFALLEVVRR